MKILSRPYSTLGVLRLCVLAIGLIALSCASLACSDDGVSEETTALDAGGDADDADDAEDAVLDADTGDTTSDSGDADVEVDTFTPPDPFTIEELSKQVSTLTDFHWADHSYGVEFTRRYTDSESSGPYSHHSMVYLLDFSDPDNVELADALAEDARAEGVIVDGKTIVVWRGGSDEFETGMQAKSYDTSGGTFEELDTLDIALPALHSSLFLDVVTDGERVLVVTYETIFELGVDAEGQLELTDTVDRSDDMDPSPGLGARGLVDAYTMTGDGYLISLYEQVQVWRLDASEGETALVSSLDVDSVGSGSWAYNRANNMIYIGGNDSFNPENADDAYAIDVADPTSPAIVGQWSVKGDFGHEASGLRHTLLHDGRLYLGYQSFGGTIDAIWRFDVGTNPETIAPLTALESVDLPDSPEFLKGTAIQGENLFYGYEGGGSSLTPPRVKIGSVPLSAFSQQNN